jgi:hypothetical protein
MRLLALVLTVLIISCGCGKRKNVAKTVQDEPSHGSDSTYIFDGKTLNGWEITNFGPQGPVEVSGGRILLGMGDGCTGITYKRSIPDINYEVSLEAKRVSGTDFFCGLTFPVGKSPCSLIVGGWGGTVVGLSSIDGLDASDNETMINRKFEKGQWYMIRLQVTDSTIKAWIDDEQLVNFKYCGRVLSIRPEVNLSKPLGIASWCTTAALRNIRLRRI